MYLSVIELTHHTEELNRSQNKTTRKSITMNVASRFFIGKQIRFLMQINYRLHFIRNSIVSCCKAIVVRMRKLGKNHGRQNE